MTDRFPKVKEAREALKEKALAILAKYEHIIDLAIEEGNLEVAAEHTRWLLAHLPNEDGVRLIDPDASKPKDSDGPRGPQIQIGVMLTPPAIKPLPVVKLIENE